MLFRSTSSSCTTRGKVVHPHKHRPGAMCASLAAKQIDSIGAHAQHDVPWILPKFWVFEVQRLPLARILRVTQHLVFLFISRSFTSSSRFFFSLSACQRRSFATLGSVKYRCRRGVIGKYHTTFRGAFFLFLYQVTPHTVHMVGARPDK